jgi:hypothetical protein
MNHKAPPVDDSREDVDGAQWHRRSGRNGKEVEVSAD